MELVWTWFGVGTNLLCRVLSLEVVVVRDPGQRLTNSKSSTSLGLVEVGVKKLIEEVFK